MKFCLTCSAGGHLTQMRELERFFTKNEHFFVLYENRITKSLARTEKVYFVVNPEREPILYLQNFLQSLRIFLKEKPNVIITMGAGISLMICIIAKLLRKKVIFIESFSRVNNPSSFGKLVYPISDLTIVQWKALLKYYKDAVYGGPIFDLSSNKNELKFKEKNQIFVTVGTGPQFNRLIKEIDKIAKKGTISKKIIAQIGNSDYKPDNCEWFRFESLDKFKKHIQKSKIIITHDGAGTLIRSLRYGKNIIIVPRLLKYDEVGYNNGFPLARQLNKEFEIPVVLDVNNLKFKIKNIENNSPTFNVHSNNQIPYIIKEFLDRSPPNNK